MESLVNYLESITSVGVEKWNAETIELVSEALKVVFNLLLSSGVPDNPVVTVEEDLLLQRRLTKLIRQIVLTKSTVAEKAEELKRYDSLQLV